MAKLLTTSLTIGTTTTVKTRRRRKEVETIIRSATYAINGRGPDLYGFRRVFFGAVAYTLFDAIYTAFLAKSSGSADELGFTWPDLKPKTKAYGRLDARAGIPLPGPKYRPTLSAAHDKAWRGVYSRLLHRLQARHVPDAHNIAAGSAWIFVKDLGAQPLIDLCRDKRIPILQKTGRLAESLAPSPLQGDGRYSPINADQVFRVNQLELTLGSKVPYAEWVDRKRKLWPANISVWMGRAITEGRAAITAHLATVIGS